MAASASSSQVKHDVFISFRGSDIRSGFLSHLKKELRRKQVDVYVDDRLERGDEISSALDEAIEGSMIALVIFSKDYASSKWCLQELVKIMERKETSQQIVIPIFYYVPPTDVRNQTGAYAESFNDHEQRFKDNMDKLKIWRSVLTKTANLSGHDSPNFQDESELIDAIVTDVLKKLKVDNHSVPTSQLVGSHENLDSVESLMEINDSQEVRFIGIWGMGGIGKTTLAREIYNRFSSEFGSHCFLDKVREESTGITSLYGKLLYELFGEKDLHKNMNDAKRRLQRVKALIVLDDVDNPSQLKGARQILINLGLGSRVIVTSRDKHVLRSGRIDEKYIHEVKGLKFDESLELFSSHAFDQSHPKVGYEELSKMIVHNFAKGNPLALEVLGSHFHSRDEVYWKSELEKLKTCPHRRIQDILRVSYDGLDDMDKEIFLDIAFFFIGAKKDSITQVLEACGFKAVSGIQNLMDKAIIKTNQCGGIIMHDLILEMGEQIVREECKDPRLRSRLKDANEIYRVLKSNMETDKIEGILLDLDAIKYLRLHPDTFSKMKNLRFLKFFHPGLRILQIDNIDETCNIELPLDFGPFPNQLRYFQWDQYPSESLPLTNFCFENLVEIHMEDSNIKNLWDGEQDLVNLKTLNLRGSEKLVDLPDFSKAHNLKEVDLSECRGLRSVHPSILSLQSLVTLDVSFCKKLESLESKTHLESLSHLNVEGCESLKKFYLSSEKLKSIYLWECSQVERLHLLPMRGFTKLRSLVIEDGERLSSLLIRELCGLTNLEYCEIRNFQQEINTGEMSSLFDAWHNLKELCLDSWSKLSEIPDNIKALTSLKYISLRNCQGLKSILGLPPFLKELNARDCTSLEIVFSDSPVWNRCQFDFKNCIKLKEDSIHFIEELLTHFSLTSTCKDGLSYVGARYPGSKLPEWIEYKQITEPSNAIEFTCNLERSPRLLFCCVVPHHLLPYCNSFFCDFSYDDKNEFHRKSHVGWDGGEMNSDHVVLWHMERFSFGAEKGNDANISCKFYTKCWNDDIHDVEKVPFKACGVHVTYMSESDLTEERLPPTKKQKTFRCLPTS